MRGHHTNTSLSAAGDARMVDLHNSLVRAVSALASSEGWLSMLQVAARMRTYSMHNILLIAAQKPEATLVAGYQGWRDRGRTVVKGEHGIKILAPCLYQPDDDDPAPAHLDGQPLGLQLRGFRVVHVFDVSQTAGAALLDFAPGPLCGGAPDHLWDALETQINAAGFTVERGDCGPAFGITKFNDHTVRVRDNLEPAHAVKTLAHELGHILADHETRYLQAETREPACREAAEVEAESIAYLVTASAGLDTTVYSVPYVAGWAGNDLTLPYITAQVVISVATTITEQLARYEVPRHPASNRFQQSSEHLAAAARFTEQFDTYLHPAGPMATDDLQR